jgi:hypothetical protein
MTWDNWVRHAVKQAVVQVHVGTAHLAVPHFQDGRARLDLRKLEVEHFNRRIARRHHGGPAPDHDTLPLSWPLNPALCA